MAWFRSSFAALLSVVLSSCAGAPAPQVVPPAIALGMHPYLGNPLLGTGRGEVVGEPLAAVRADWLWLETPPETVPLPAQARALVTFAAPVPFAVAVPASAVGLLSAEQLAELPARVAAGACGAVQALAPQVCAVWSTSGVAFVANAAPSEVHVFAAKDGRLQVALVESAATASVAVLEATLPVAGAPVGLCFELPATGARARSALICQLRAQRAVPTALAEGCRAELVAMPAVREVVEQNPQLTTAAASLPGTTRRAALVHLATQGGCALLGEFVLVADDAALAMLAETAQTEIAGAANAVVPVAFAVQAAALRWLAAARERDDLSPELASVAARHLGEVAYSSSALTRAAAAASPAALSAALRSDNLLALEAPEPLVRVRAFDWLTRRDCAPQDFDPLASRQARRAALAAAEGK